MKEENTKIFIQLLNFNQFAFMGIFFKFFGIYLKENGLSDSEVGLVFMLAPLTHITVTFFFGYFSNRFQFEEKLLKLLTFFSFVFSLFYFFIDIIFYDIFFGFVIGTILLSLTRTPVLAILDSTSLSFVRKYGGTYSSIRLWGSVGFIFSVMCLGLLNDYFPYIRELPLYAMSFFLLLSHLSSRAINSKPTKDKKIKIKELISIFQENRLLLPFFILTFLHIISMAAYHIFFGLYIMDMDKGLSYPGSYLGYLTFVAVFSEIVFFYYYASLEKLISPFRFLSFIFLLTAIRWYILFATSSLLWIFIAQLLHSFSWGAFFIMSMHYVGYFFKERLRTSGISLFSVLVFGCGNVLGFFIAGRITENSLHYADLFFYCFFLSLLTFFISLFLSRYEKVSFRL